MSFDFDLPQFNTQQLLACSPGLNHETFKQWLKRDAVLLSVGSEIGRGRRPLYRGVDVLQVALRHDLTSYGAFTTKFRFIWDLVNGRIIARQTGLIAINPGPISTFLHLHPRSGELMALTVSESDEQDPIAINEKDVPDLHLFLRIDRFIDRMVERMERVKADLPAVEPIKTEDTKNWTGEWSVDEAGERVLVGLTRKETEELAGLGQLVVRNQASKEQTDRYHELDVRHVEARAWRMASQKPERDEDDFFRKWIVDDHGVKVMVGLTAEETEEYIRLQARDLASRMSDHCFPWGSVEEMRREKSRSLKLNNKHESARQRRLAEEYRRKA